MGWGRSVTAPRRYGSRASSCSRCPSSAGSSGRRAAPTTGKASAPEPEAISSAASQPEPDCSSESGKASPSSWYVFILKHQSRHKHRFPFTARYPVPEPTRGPSHLQSRVGQGRQDPVGRSVGQLEPRPRLLHAVGAPGVGPAPHPLVPRPLRGGTWWEQPASVRSARQPAAQRSSPSPLPQLGADRRASSVTQRTEATILPFGLI